MLFPDERLTSYLLNPAVIMCNPTCYDDAHEACILHWIQIACFDSSYLSGLVGGLQSRSNACWACGELLRQWCPGGLIFQYEETCFHESLAEQMRYTLKLYTERNSECS